MKVIHRVVNSTLLSLALMAPALLLAANLPEFREIVKESSPAVVKIIVEHDARSMGQGQPSPEQMPEYLRRFFEFRGGQPPQQQEMAMG